MKHAPWLALCLWFAAQPAIALKVGLVLDKGGKDDKSFNASAYLGATEAQKQLGITLKVVESSDDAGLEPALRTFAQHGYDLVVGIGYIQRTPIERVAKKFPKTKFLLVDSHVDNPNVRSIRFNEHEGSFLVGALAAMASKSGTVGFLGGMDIPLIRRFETAYKAGAKHINPQVGVISNFVGEGSDAWRNPTKGKELALSQINKKVDVLFAAAGASALGAFDAAEQKKILMIGCDSNQNWIKPGLVLTSMLKRVDKAVFETVRDVKDGKFTAGKLDWGIKEGAIDYALDEHNKTLLTAAMKAKVDSLKNEIVSGKIKVPDFYLLGGKKESSLSSTGLGNQWQKVVALTP